ncbi:hypothetical protein RD110_15830 [Rhodoferax koreense]|uniref:Uncharacterized protein n=1 Tax=Rhodoferax koreensis TaxID=1842727 RepID=A0A1P8JXR8_9BURK|nr:hypothetical protein [Rhodoferax koreense]APW38491.1 hypothetical protein RD110_15830 [Rhodoferax koreense]
MTAPTAAEVAEFAIQAHDQLHKGDIGKAHEMLHKAMGIDNDKALPAQPMAHTVDFDRAFRDLCREHGRKAMFILADKTDALGRTRIMTGGDAQLCATFDRKLKA